MATTAIGLSEKQQALRQQGIGASEVFDVLNGGIITYARKVGEADPFEGNSLTEFGHRIERVIGEAWADRHRDEGVRVYTPGTLVHAQHPWALATLDRVVAPAGVGRPARATWLRALEIKTVFFSSSEYGEGADEVPEHHLVQVQWQLEVADLEEATLVALVNGDYREYPIHRDREVGGMLLEVVGRFWREHVLARVPPPITGSEAYTEYLKRRHPRDTGPMLEATPELRDLVAKVREAKAATKAAEEREALVTNQLRAELGDAAGVEGLCTWRSNKDSAKVDFDAALEGFLIRLEENPLSSGFSIPRAKTRALWAEVERDFTTTKPGARVLRFPKEK
jgi:putative phage-type endonuclease